MHSRFWRLGKRTAWLLSAVAVLALVLSGSAFAAAHAVNLLPRPQKLTTVSVQLNWLNERRVQRALGCRPPRLVQKGRNQAQGYRVEQRHQSGGCDVSMLPGRR